MMALPSDVTAPAVKLAIGRAVCAKHGAREQIARRKERDPV